MAPTPNWIVIRPAPDLPPGFLPEHLNGRWFEVSDIPVDPAGFSTGTEAVAVPAGRFEVRESDGAVAEVYEIRP